VVGRKRIDPKFPVWRPNVDGGPKDGKGFTLLREKYEFNLALLTSGSVEKSTECPGVQIYTSGTELQMCIWE
jgi:hypothetical protein